MQPIIGVYSHAPIRSVDLAGNCGSFGKAVELLKNVAPSNSQIFSLENLAIACSSRYCRVEKSDAHCLVKVAVSGLWTAPDLTVELHGGNALASPSHSVDGSSAPFAQIKITRDLFGRLPLYWFEQDGSVWFSTHMQSLMRLMESRKISAEAFYSYSSFSFVPAPLSPIDGIESIPAGSTLHISSSAAPAVSADAGWHLPQTDISNEEVAVAQLRHQLQHAVDEQTCDLRDARVAVFLSGGLDSAITAAALVRAGAKVTAYSLNFGPHGISELPFAQEVAASLGIPIKPVRALPRDIRRSLIPTVNALDTVFGDGVTVPLWLLNRAAAEDGHTVVFNGEGGDQLFGGWTNKPLIASSVYGQVSSDEDRLYEVYMRTFHKLHGHESLLFSPSMRNEIRSVELRRHINPALEDAAGVGLIHRLRKANLMLKGAQNIQPRASNVSIASGLQVRSLFCNKSLADWTFTVQPELMLRGACEKYILKRAVQDWLPEAIVYREKRGMGVPLSDWCTNSLWGHLGKYLNPRRLQQTGYWQADVAHALAIGEVSAHLTGRRVGETLWLILMWEAWLACNSDSISAHTRYNAFWPPVPLLRLWRREATGV